VTDTYTGWAIVVLGALVRYPHGPTVVKSLRQDAERLALAYGGRVVEVEVVVREKEQPCASATN
jgi:hypothetical protein